MVFTKGILTDVGISLIAEGVGDIFFAVESGLSGSFSWKKYAKHKVLSMTLTIAMSGIGRIVSALN